LERAAPGYGQRSQWAGTSLHDTIVDSSTSSQKQTA